MTVLDPALAKIIDEAQVGRLVGRYASMTDWLDWSGVTEIFTADAHFDFGELYNGGRDGFIPFVAALEGGYDRRIHLFGLPRIDVAGDHAQVDCPSWIHARNKGPENHADVMFAGRYRFEARRERDGWKLSRLTYYLNMLDVTQPPAGPEAPTRLADAMAPGHPDRP